MTVAVSRDLAVGMVLVGGPLVGRDEVPTVGLAVAWMGLSLALTVTAWRLGLTLGLTWEWHRPSARRMETGRGIRGWRLGVGPVSAWPHWHGRWRGQEEDRTS